MTQLIQDNLLVIITGALVALWNQLSVRLEASKGRKINQQLAAEMVEEQKKTADALAIEQKKTAEAVAAKVEEKSAELKKNLNQRENEAANHRQALEGELLLIKNYVNGPFAEITRQLLEVQSDNADSKKQVAILSKTLADLQPKNKAAQKASHLATGISNTAEARREPKI